MVKIEESGPAKDVPLVYYDEDGERHIVGTASVQLVRGQLQVVGRYDNIPGATRIDALNLESFSIGPFTEPKSQNSLGRGGNNGENAQ